ATGSAVRIRGWIERSAQAIPGFGVRIGAAGATSAAALEVSLFGSYELVLFGRDVSSWIREPKDEHEARSSIRDHQFDRRRRLHQVTCEAAGWVRRSRVC